jgi:hypothetical protein
MGGSGTGEASFTWYWYHLVWALEELERNEDRKWHYDGSREMRAILRDALTRLETAMDRTLLTELRQSHRRKVAGGRWVQLSKRLESLKRPRESCKSQETPFLAGQAKRLKDEESAIHEELTALEQELGDEEIARIRGIKPLPRCGTAIMEASEWTAEKQREEDFQLVRAVEEFLAGKELTH